MFCIICHNCATNLSYDYVHVCNLNERINNACIFKSFAAPMSVYVHSEIPIHQIIEAIDQFSKETGALSGINK